MAKRKKLSSGLCDLYAESARVSLLQLQGNKPITLYDNFRHLQDRVEVQVLYQELTFY